MMDEQVFLGHMLESIEAIESYTSKITKDDFLKDQKIQDAVHRRFEIIGEASKHLSDTLKAQHPDIVWKQITGMRDVLIHDYFGIDLNFVWHTARYDLPKFKKQILKMIK